MDKRAVTFGEIMLRLSSPDHEKLLQSPTLKATFGGGEANVAVSLSILGAAVKFVSVLPQNDLGDACIRYLRGFSINTDHILRGGNRIGIYFLEIGANQRPSKVIYDRAESSISQVYPITFDWGVIFRDVDWFHVSGITPAIGLNCAETIIQAVQKAQELGVTVSCDYNYRSKLWKYGKDAPEIMRSILKFVDIGIGNEEDCQLSLGISHQDGNMESDIEAGKIDPNKYRILCEKVLEEFPNLKLQAITLRESISASWNGWSACLHNRENFFVGKRYEITDIVDRVGAGDAFAAGLIFGSMSNMTDKEALDFAIAASCLKHSCPGDLNLANQRDIFNLMDSSGSGRVQR